MSTSKKQGVNPNAVPFVPRFASAGKSPAMAPTSAAALSSPQPAPQSAPPPPQYPSSPPPSYATTSPAAPPAYQPAPPPPFSSSGSLPPPPPFVPGGALAPMYGGAGFPAAPPFAAAPPPPPPTYAATSPGLQPRSTYEQVMKSRGTPDSKLLSPSASPSSGAVDAAPPVALPESVVAGKQQQQQPIVLLFLGPRGSGKSTQARLAAEKLNLLFVSAGELIRAKKQPFVELRRLVEEHFPNGKVGAYRGLSLDRFIVTGEADVYYLQWALSPALPVPRVFLLLLDWETGLQRADARSGEDQRLKSNQRRMIEYRAHFDACENIYAHIHALDRVDCEGHSLEAIHQLILQQVEMHSARHNLCPAASALPPPVYAKDIVSICMITDLNRFHQLKSDIHTTLGTPNVEFAPVSQMSGIIDETSLGDRKLRAALACTYFVTLKADGQRLIVVKHKTLGVVGLPQKFTSAYDLNALLAAAEWPSVPTESNASDPIEWIMDCELIKSAGASVPTIYAFDFIYMHGVKATSTRFALRLEALTEYFSKLKFLTNAPKTMQLKSYVKVSELRTLLPDYKAAPFEIDGVAFQPDAPYHYGMDKTLFKWKPQEKCTVDFRLYGCEEPHDKETEFTFVAKVQESLAKLAAAAASASSSPTTGPQYEEVTYPNIEIRIPAAVVDREQLCDGSIVECVRRLTSTTASSAPPAGSTTKSSTTATKGQHHQKTTSKEKDAISQTEIWDFYRNRTDKLVPNRIDVAARIASIKHISYEALLTICDALK
eukprot:CAMPEP_0176438266 /NCGR_PEP_ID=MMETSP0127-20121128/19171_1 /TAXON_ID=938130 /ORGANISM="Platyophrya macrostoma, Strain WH" /LENGTH=770 /DNA_ID=CAMNT_0017822163 /DNA_START=156 /DNA_END=2468 /DNA_ORIENTATION=-